MFKTVSHRLIHDALPTRWDLLQRVDGLHIVQVAGAVQIPLLVAHHLLEEHISTRLPLLLFEQQVVRARNLIMFIVLNVCYSLV